MKLGSQRDAWNLKFIVVLFTVAKLDMVTNFYNITILKVKREVYEFKTSITCIASSRLACTTNWDPVSKAKIKQHKINRKPKETLLEVWRHPRWLYENIEKYMLYAWIRITFTLLKGSLVAYYHIGSALQKFFLYMKYIYCSTHTTWTKFYGVFNLLRLREAEKAIWRNRKYNGG